MLLNGNPLTNVLQKNWTIWVSDMLSAIVRYMISSSPTRFKRTSYITILHTSGHIHIAYQSANAGPELAVLYLICSQSFWRIWYDQISWYFVVRWIPHRHGLQIGPANTGFCPGVVLMLYQRRRRWANIKTTPGQRPHRQRPHISISDEFTVTHASCIVLSGRVMWARNKWIHIHYILQDRWTR